MIKTCLSSNGYRVENTQSVILFNKSSELTLNVMADNGFCFAVVFTFRNDDAEKSQVLHKSIENGRTVRFDCINFNSPIGTASIEPIEIAMIDNRRLFIHIAIYQINETAAKNVTFTLYSDCKAGD